jgi:transcriptional regulator with XRE-family HTH domain
MPVKRSVVAIRIEELRKERDLSRAELAQQLRTTRMRIYRLEKGLTEITVGVAEKVARVLRVPVGDLYERKRAS